MTEAAGGAGKSGATSDAPTVAKALGEREESVFAGRSAFLAIVWLTAAIGLVAHGLESSIGPVLGAIGILAALAVWIHGVHRVQSWDGHVPTGRYLLMTGGAAVALAALLLIDSSYLILLFGVFTLIFAFARDNRSPLIMSGVVTAIWLIAWVAYDLPSGGIATPILLWGTLNVLAQVSTRISAQSTERRDLLAQLDAARTRVAALERDRGMLEERQRLAAEIHDTLAQGFTSIVLVSEATTGRLDSLPIETVGRNLNMIESTARDNLTAARSLVEDLRPPELDRTSLAEALAQLVDRRRDEARSMGGDRAVEVTFEASGEPRPLGGSIDVALLRATQEALANAMKHAEATTIAVRLDHRSDGVGLTIADDGKGFGPDGAPAAVAGGTGGRGLDLLRARVEQAGGTVTVESSPGRGTQLSINVPLGPAAGNEHNDGDWNGNGENESR